MKHVFFKSVSFIRDDYNHARLSGKDLIISVGNYEIPVQFKTVEEAIEGLEELNDLMNGESTKSKKEPPTLIELLMNKSNEDITSVLDSVTSKLNSVLDDAKDKVQEKVLEHAFKGIKSKSTDRMNDMADRLGEVLDTLFTKPIVQEEKEEKEERTRFDRHFSRQDIFNFTQKTQDKLIGDMTTTELKDVISSWVDTVLQDERAEAMFESVRSNFSKEDEEKAILAYKNIIFNVARQFENKTLQEVLRDNFM